MKFSKNTIQGVYNYLKIGEEFTTSGQPTAAQFLFIRDAGYRTIINLAPANAENSLPDEARLVKSLGLNYIHIPVDFKKPRTQDFQQFVESLEAANFHETWIHCAANMRVSAFVYKYRCEVLNDDPENAREALNKIWEPLGVWKKFVKTH